jgi:carboxyl-terminal processing protease
MQNNLTPTKERARKYAHVYFSVIMSVILFGLGIFTGQIIDSKKLITKAADNSSLEANIININRSQNNSKEIDFEQFWKVWDMVKAKYAKQPVKDADLFYGAMQGMVAGLGDPYSVYFPPKAAEEFNKSLDGEFSGVGMEVGIKNDQLVVIAPLDGTPAKRAGLLPGDKIYAIDKIPTAGMDTNSAVEKIRGQAGTKVTLTIGRAGLSKPKDFVIVREKINVQSVSFSIKNKNIGYIRIMQFNQDTVAGFNKAVAQLQAKKINKLVVDLRNNPGGYLDAAVTLASEWIPDGQIVSEKFSNGVSNEHLSIGAHRLQDTKTVVLVNGGSASASEILAGALQDTKHATIVGETTFGKGSVQDYETLNDGSALKVTVAEWYTPLGKNINKQGIVPDVVVKEDWSKEKVGEDVMLQKAYSIFAGKAKTAVTK